MVHRPTLKDVAELANVSTATVARVLHGKGYVAPNTRRVVEQALAESGYQINAVAQGLRRQRTLTIGHVLHSFIPNQFFAAVAIGVEEIASQNGCGVLMINTYGEFERERRAVETLIQRRVDAMIFTTAAHVDNVRLAVRSSVPVVQVERMTSVDTPVVTADNFGGAYEATEHLIRLGHRSIAFIGVDPAALRSRPGVATHPDIEHERLSGYLTALSDHRIPVDESLIGFETNYISGSATDEKRGYRWMHAFLDRPSPPTAVFATFDLFAANALQAIYERSLRVPDDISVVGFDDTYAPFLTPPMTAVENPKVELGRMAARLVFQQLDHAKATAASSGTRLPMKLNVRSSTAPPRSCGSLEADEDDAGMSSMTCRNDVNRSLIAKHE